jgi:hypothetical protein
MWPFAKRMAAADAMQKLHKKKPARGDGLVFR